MLNQFRTWVVWVTFFVSVTSTDEDLNLPLLYVFFAFSPRSLMIAWPPCPPSPPSPCHFLEKKEKLWAGNEHKLKLSERKIYHHSWRGDLIRTFPKSWYCQWPKILGYCTNCNGNSNWTRLLSESFQILRICLGQLVSGAHKWQANTTAPISILTVSNT